MTTTLLGSDICDDLLAAPLASRTAGRPRLARVGRAQAVADGDPVFRQLNVDPALFAQVYVDPETASIVCPTGADLAPKPFHSDQYAGASTSHR